MRAIVQRVSSARLTVGDRLVSKIGKGLVALVGFCESDNEKTIKFVCDKITDLRIFSDSQDKLNLSAKDIDGEILFVSNFTVYGETAKGRRPSFIKAAPSHISEPMYDLAIQILKQSGLTIKSGEFGADMLVEINNDGPITVIVEKENENC